MNNVDKVISCFILMAKETNKLINRIGYILLLPIYLLIFIFSVKDIKQLISVWWELFKQGDVYND